MRARYYDPSIHRFTSEDPAEDGLNWYAYCGNNPVMFSDPSGYITEEEMSMYENNQMAPMAYSYLMNLTYQWYLADEQSSKEYYHQLADDFRKAGYTTTNGLFRNVDEGIAFMDKKPNGWSGAISLTEKEHLFRNKLNLNFSWTDFQKLNERLPDDMKWTKVIATLHKNNIVNNKENIKYVSADGHFEVIYNGNNELLTGVNNPQDMGTYNYCSPITDATGHTYYDILPYLQYGNI